MDFKGLREAMVKTQLLPRGIRDLRVLKAMTEVPRHLFVDSSRQHLAYEDMALPTADGQTISQPYMVAVMTELLELSGTEKVLEIGTGSGYQAVILAELGREVYTIERVADLAEQASGRFRDLAYSTIFQKTGDGTLGWPDEAPFDRIIVTAGAPDAPQPLIDQLAPDGILVIPVGDRNFQQLLRIRKNSDGLSRELHTPCMFVPLIGRFGWEAG
ncbi:MAG: protein-L-isoaspartate(D-aspartate) O-methyltransferase [Thermodesulfovibrionales bacterium]